MNITGPCTDKENIYGCILGRERINQGYSCETCVSAFFRRPRLKSILLLPCQIFRGKLRDLDIWYWILDRVSGNSHPGRMLVPIAIGIGCWEGLIKNFVN